MTTEWQKYVGGLGRELQSWSCQLRNKGRDKGSVIKAWLFYMYSFSMRILQHFLDRPQTFSKKLSMPRICRIQQVGGRFRLKLRSGLSCTINGFSRYLNISQLSGYHNLKHYFMIELRPREWDIFSTAVDDSNAPENVVLYWPLARTYAVLGDLMAKVQN